MGVKVWQEGGELKEQISKSLTVVGLYIEMFQKFSERPP